MASDRERMTELIQVLNKASESYYAKDEEIMSNFEYDALYEETVKRLVREIKGEKETREN